ncbi:MAG: NAD(P)/FAD-dependent oxidoreductase [Lachnospiraceae bacterium]|nr:NAD(P)/FAD-dependent oxidoreductase [Lachnospiraceae bacterium]
MSYDLIITGAGAAGLMAANIAISQGLSTLVIERNEKAGKKLFITGKGRCNFTNASDISTIIENICTNPSFMYSSLNAFSNHDVIGFFESLGLHSKTERGNRVFPASDKSSDVIKALLKNLPEGTILYNTRVTELLIRDGRVYGVRCGRDRYQANTVIVATGGLSYPSTGSDGDGYIFAKKAGLKVNDCTPSLVPFNIREEYCKRLQGLTLKNIGIDIINDKKSVYRDFGELLFTHFGVSGPVILSASSRIKPEILKNRPVLHIDLKPALDEKTLDARLLREFSENSNKDFINCLKSLLPSKMIPVIAELSGIPGNKKANLLTKEERAVLLSLLKDLPFTILSARGFDEAVVTKGGVDVKELDPKTFESKKIKGLYFAGEVTDIDAMTGGYNLQRAWSSAAAAARNAAKRITDVKTYYTGG